MKKPLAAASRILVALAPILLAPARAQVAADSSTLKNLMPVSGFCIEAFGGFTGLGTLVGGKCLSIPEPPLAEPYGHGALSASTTYFPSIAAAATSGLPLYAPPSITTLYDADGAVVPDNTPIRYFGFIPKVQQFTIGGDSGAAAFTTLQGYLGNAGRGTGSQVLQNIQVVSEGSGAEGQGNADAAAGISAIKNNWANTTASGGTLPQAGEMDGLFLSIRQGGPTSGPKAGQSDSNLMTGNLQSIVHSGYNASFETKTSTIDPTNGYQEVQEIGVQTAVIDSRLVLPSGATNTPSSYGQVITASVGSNKSALRIQNTGTAGTWTNLLENAIACNSSAIQNFSIASVDGSISWIPCGGGGLRLAPFSGGMAFYTGTTPVLTLDQGGNTTQPGQDTALAFASLSSIAVSAQGAYFQWNKTGSDGGTWILNQKGGGAGGVNLGEITTGNAVTGSGKFTPALAALPGSLAVTQHLYGVGSAPTVTASAGTATLSTGANDNHGTITASVSATLTLKFTVAYTNNPDCTVTPHGGALPSYSVAGGVPGNANLTITTAAAQTLTYMCEGL